MAKPLFILKLGGSPITYKSSTKRRIRKKRLLEIAHEIKRAYKKGAFRLIIILGTGSFGHPFVKKYNIRGKIQTPRQIKGLALGKYWIDYLKHQVNKTLLSVGLPIFPLQTSSLLIRDKDKYVLFNTEPLQIILKIGTIPLFSGDLVTDRTLGGVASSSDTMVSYLAQKFGAGRILFATDVNGVYDHDPRIYSKAKLIPP